MVILGAGMTAESDDKLMMRPFFRRSICGSTMEHIIGTLATLIWMRSRMNWSRLGMLRKKSGVESRNNMIEISHIQPLNLTLQLTCHSNVVYQNADLLSLNLVTNLVVDLISRGEVDIDDSRVHIECFFDLFCDRLQFWKCSRDENDFHATFRELQILARMSDSFGGQDTTTIIFLFDYTLCKYTNRTSKLSWDEKKSHFYRLSSVWGFSSMHVVSVLFFSSHRTLNVWSIANSSVKIFMREINCILCVWREKESSLNEFNCRSSSIVSFLCWRIEFQILSLQLVASMTPPVPTSIDEVAIGLHFSSQMQPIAVVALKKNFNFINSLLSHILFQCHQLRRWRLKQEESFC